MNARKRIALVISTAALGGGLALAPAADAAPGVGNIAKNSANRGGVLCVQHAVNNWAQRTGQGQPLAEDKLFGTKTETWVKKFQRASRLDDDGIVGKKTGNSILDNLQGDGTWRSACYDYVPSTRR
ncbi:peptidoglycan-binding protein [Streptomyces xiangluensis]|uniref:Peptidoglycan-binding protein n=1 Tax=Streptomyces xiangluensis TaxID=2665720 RepID=A0ABV8YZA2_9ACTN